MGLSPYPAPSHHTLEAPCLLHLLLPGAAQGYLFDPPTMDLLASSPGMMAALQLWKSLLRYNSPVQLVQSCGTFEPAFSQGSCAFTVSQLISWSVGG